MPICKECGSYYSQSSYVTGCPTCAKENEQSLYVENLQSSLKQNKDLLENLRKTQVEEESKYELKVNSLIKTIDELQSNFSRVSETVSGIENQISVISEEVVGLETNLVDVQRRRNELSGKQTELKEENTQLDIQIEETTKKIDLRRKELDEEKIRLTAEADTQISDSDDQKSKLEALFSKVSLDQGIVQKELDQKKFAKTQMEQQLNKEKELFKSYNDELNELKNQKLVLNQEMHTMSATLEETRKNLKSKQKGLTELKERAEKIQIDVSNSEGEVSEATILLDSSNKKMEMPAAELNELASDTHALTKKIEELKGKVTETEKKFVEAKEAGDQDKIIEATMKLDLAKNLLNGAEEERDQKRQGRDSKQNIVAVSEKEIIQAKGNLEEKQTSWRMTKDTAEDQKLKLIEAEKAIKITIQDLENLENALKNKKIEYQKLDDKINGLNTRIAERNVKLEDTNSSLSVLTREFEELNQKSSQIKTNKTQTEQELSQVQQKIEEAEKKKNKLI